MHRKYKYKTLFGRNYGVFSSVEIEKIKNLRVAVVGAGGLGGPVAYLLARLGVHTIKMADPERFEPSNTNRQFGAYTDTIGKFKVEVITKDLKRINPYLRVEKYNGKITKKNVSLFLKDTDVVFDCIDFFSIDDEIALHREAAKRGKWVYTAQGALYIFTFMSFNPNGFHLYDLINSKKENGLIRKVVKLFFPILPKEATPEVLKKVYDGNQIHISSHATTHPLVGALLVEEMINIQIRGIKPRSEAPDCFVFDLKKMKNTFIKRKRNK